MTSIYNPAINPSNVAFAPRLSSIANAFERFRFRKLRIRYHSASPATRSGAIGILIDFDVSDAQPSSMVQLAANEAARVGTVADDLDCFGSWPPTTPFLLMTPDTSVSSDPQWRYPGRIWILTSDSVTADVGLIAGYVSIEYEVEMMRMRPPTNAVIAGPAVAVQDPTVGGGNSRVRWAFDNVIGFWDWYRSQTAVRPGGTSITYDNSVAASPGVYNTSYLLDYSAATVDEEHFVVIRPNTAFRKETKVRWLNPQFACPPVLGEVKSPDWAALFPSAAGDCTVQLLCRNIATGVATVIASTLFSPGVGASVFEDVFTFTLTEACQLVLNVVPTGVETRTIDGADSSWAVCLRQLTE
jgi:hypothetical protein